MPSVYYLSPPDPSWSKEKQDAFVPSYGNLLFTSVHEVMPGHFVQFLHANRSPSKFGSLFRRLTPMPRAGRIIARR